MRFGPSSDDQFSFRGERGVGPQPGFERLQHCNELEHQQRSWKWCIATFDATNTPSIVIDQNTTVGEIDFTPNAPSVQIHIDASPSTDTILTIDTNGIVNQNAPDTIPVFTLTGGTHIAGLAFAGAGSAANAVINGTPTNSSVTFNGSTDAGNAVIDAADIAFSGNSSAALAQITSRHALNFSGSATASSALITNDGTAGFSGSSTADSSTILNNGALSFSDTSTGGATTIVESANATLDISGLTNGIFSVHSISGGGQILLGSNTLQSGGDNLNATISAMISGSGGALVKIGNGTLTLTGANTYTGSTKNSAGTLQVGAGGSAGSISGDIVGNSTLVVDRSDSITLAVPSRGQELCM